MDRISFLNNYPILQSAVCDSSAPLPGYIFEDIKAICFISEAHCNLLLEYLTTRLDTSNTSNVKYRVLKVIEYVLKNGNEDFGTNLRKNMTSIQSALGFNGQPDAVYGNKKYEAVRKVADDIIKILFQNSEDGLPQSHSSEPTYGISGMGSHASSSRMEGFGNTPVPNSQPIGGQLANDVSDIVDRMFNISSPTKPRVGGLTTDEVDGNFQAFKTPFVRNAKSDDAAITVQAEKPVKQKARKGKRRPGRAGGGWEDDDYDNDQITETNSNCSALPEIADITSPNDELSKDVTSVESTFLDQFSDCSNLNADYLTNATKQISLLNCHNLLDIIKIQLANLDDSKKYKAMLLLELVLHTDVLTPEIIHQVLYDQLMKIRQSSVDNSLKIKAHKLGLILNKLRDIVK